MPPSLWRYLSMNSTPLDTPASFSSMPFCISMPLTTRAVIAGYAGPSLGTAQPPVLASCCDLSQTMALSAMAAAFLS